MIAFVLLFLIVFLIKIIHNDLVPLFNKNKYEFFFITALAVFGTSLFILQIFDVKIVSPLQALSLWFEKIGLTFKG